MVFQCLRCLAVALAAMLVLSCGPSGLSKPPTTDAAPQRIVSMSPGITETLFALGCGNRVVGVTNYCRYPEQTLELPRIGGYLDPSLEAVVALNPDLVLVMESQQGIAGQLSGMGIQAFSIDQHNVDSVLVSFDRIGELCGATDAGRNLRSAVENRMARIQELVSGRDRPKVLAVIGRNVGGGEVASVWAASASTFIGDVVALAGGDNVVTTGVQGAHPEISTEGLLFLDPEIILDIVPEEQAGDLSSENIALDWRSLDALQAVRSGRVHVLRQPYVVIPGPRTAEVVEAVARVLHPELSW